MLLLSCCCGSLIQTALHPCLMPAGFHVACSSRKAVMHLLCRTLFEVAHGMQEQLGRKQTLWQRSMQSPTCCVRRTLMARRVPSAPPSKGAPLALAGLLLHGCHGIKRVPIKYKQLSSFRQYNGR